MLKNIFIVFALLQAVACKKQAAVDTTAVAPSDLVYSPAAKTLSQGSTASSSSPTIKGTQPISYSLSSVPATSDITISSGGIISASATLTAGSYAVSVTASNAAGSKTFNNAFSFTVNSAALGFVTTIKPIVIKNCDNCHTGSTGTNYTDYTNAKNDIDLILDRIQRSVGSSGFMPKNGTALSATDINSFKQWKVESFPQ